LAEPVSPELALVDPVLRERLLAELCCLPAPAPTRPTQRREARGRLTQKRLVSGLTGLALVVGIAIGLLFTLPHRSAKSTRWFPTLAAPDAAHAQPGAQPTYPTASPVVVVTP